jgi:hypothetical protein
MNYHFYLVKKFYILYKIFDKLLYYFTYFWFKNVIYYNHTKKLFIK